MTQQIKSLKGNNIPPVIDLCVRERAVNRLRLIKIKHVFPDGDVVFLGCARPNIYLTVPDGKGGYQKFAGKTLRRAPCAIEDTRGWIQSGFFVRFRNLPANASDRIRSAMLLHHGKKYLTCVNASVRIMQDGGFTAGDKPLSSIYFPDQLMQALFSNDLKFDGKRIEVEVTRTTPLNIEKYTEEIVRAIAAKLFRLGATNKMRGSAAE